MNRLLFFVCSYSLTLMLFAPSDAQKPQVSHGLKYNWKVGQKYGYDFEIVSGEGDEKDMTKGFLTLEADEVNVTKGFSGQALVFAEEGESTSTAFVVSPDGYMLTCAHCVGGAIAVNVNVEGRDYKAKIVSVDDKLDIALIKIEAKGLPTMLLGKHSKVELAQEVRTIGFPLSDMLGSSVKISRGSIAGFIEGDGAQSFQIDAAVNPGNSGGPLVDDTGAVIGIVNAKLHGKRISKVGFAVPIRHACNLMDKLKIKYLTSKSDQSLSGPELAKKLTPAVGFVSTEIGEGGFYIASNFQFSVSGNVDTESEKKREVIQSRMIIDSRGQVLESVGETGLPLLFGRACMLPVESLPDVVSMKSWTEVDMLMLPLPKTAEKKETRRDRFGHPFFGRDFGGFPFERDFGHPFARQRKVEKPELRIALTERKRKYRVVESTDEYYKISCSESMKTLNDENEFASLRVDYQSELTFDRRLGIFVDKNLTGNFSLKLGGEENELPITLTCKYIDIKKAFGSQDFDPELTTAERAKAKSASSAGRISEFLDSKPGKFDDKNLLNVLVLLAKSKVELENQDAVVERLKLVLASDSKNIRKPAIDALLNWDPNAATPFVIEGFNSAGPFSRRGWIAMLGHTKHLDSASLLCEQLSDGDNRAAAVQALIAIGPVAESSVLAHLGSHVSKSDVAIASLSVLSNIGSADTLAIVEELLKSNELGKSKNAKRVVNAFRQRLKTQK